MKNDTIVALATPPGISALGVIRISGKDSIKIVENLVKEAEKFKKEKDRVIGVYRLIGKDKKEIDQITAVKYSEPRSYTGENMVEVICHGGKFLINRIIDELVNNGAVCAQKGEFTKRAFLNKKMDIIEAEAVNCLINSKNEKESENALIKIQGKHKSIIENWKKEIIEIIADIEAEIEFGEAENSISDDSIVLDKINQISKKIEIEINKRERNQAIEDGIEILIAGPVNAGKSTLFNKILGYERSIVSRVEGTTRDIVSENIMFFGKQIKIIDTAGIRKTDDEIEVEGIKRTKESIKEASVVIWVTAADEEITSEEIDELKNIKNKILVLNKIDKDKKSENKENEIQKIEKDFIKISLKNNTGEEIVIKRLKNEIEKIIDKYEITDIIQTKRQYMVMKEIQNEIQSAKEFWKQKEIAVMSLNKIIEYFEECLGKIDKEEVYNRIFETFCIGK